MTRILALLTLSTLSTAAIAGPGIGDAPTYRECRAAYNSDKAQCRADFGGTGHAAQYDACMDAAADSFATCMAAVKRAALSVGTDGLTASASRARTESVDFVLVDTDGVRTFLGNVDVDADGRAELRLGHDQVVREVLASGGRIVVE